MVYECRSSRHIQFSKCDHVSPLPHSLHWLSTTTSPRAHLHVVGRLRPISDINQLSLPIAFYSVLVSFSVFLALSTVFYSTNSPDNSPLSDTGLPVLSLPFFWSFKLYLFMKVSFSPDIIPSA